MKFKAPIIAMAVLVGLPTAALAQPEGWYMGLGAGLNLQRDADVTGSGINSTVDFDTGALGAATLGYKFGAPRLELEFSYRGNNVDSIDGANGSGRTRTQALMTNLLYDFDLGGFTPYVGVGIGGAAVKYKNVGPFGAASLNDSDLVFAYQGIAGVGYQVTEQLGLFADYRYFATRDAGLTTSGGAGVDAEYAAHSVLVGLRWAFGAPAKPAPAPAPAPAAAPAPAPQPAAQPAPPAVPRNYLVFFDFDRSDLTPDARQIVQLAADNAKKGGISRLHLVGHADRSGPAAYNMRLSQRRADSVQAALASDGIPAGQISTEARGETDPLVPTADGVREPQNRRVEIIFR